MLSEALRLISALPSTHMNHSSATGASAGLQVQTPIANHEALIEFRAKKISRLPQKVRTRFPANTALIRSMCAEGIPIHGAPPFVHQQLIHARMNGHEIFQSNQPPPHPALICDHD